MPLDNLDAPLRLTWDLCPEGHGLLTVNEIQRVAERLVDAGIFFLSLEEQPLLHPDLPILLERLAAGGCQLNLVIGDDPAEILQLKQLSAKFNLFVDASFWLAKDAGLEALESFFMQLRQAGHSPALLWVPTSGQIESLPVLLQFCERLEIPKFKLPNPKVNATSEALTAARLLQSEDIDALRQQFEQAPFVAGMTVLEVHDLFLWELLFPLGGGERSEYGGCQAANSLGHIAVNADLWPCSSWPQVIGNLLQDDLLALWDSAVRHQVRSEVAQAPSDCAGCITYASCFGGCRGIARSFRTDGGGRDLLCAAPRKMPVG